MSTASKPRPVISLCATGGVIRANEQGTGTFLDVTFKCAFAEDEEGISGSGVSIGPEQIFCVAQLADTAYVTIYKLLTAQRQAKPAAR